MLVIDMGHMLVLVLWLIINPYNIYLNIYICNDCNVYDNDNENDDDDDDG